LKADNTSLRESCFGFELSKNALEPRTVFKVIWIIAWVERRFTKPGSQYVISYDAHCRVISRASSAGAQLQPRDACGLEGKASWDGEEKRGSDRQAFNLHDEMLSVTNQLEVSSAHAANLRRLQVALCQA
jgi:hypothetical protein